MEGITTFLESSTIHGLTYISSTRKYARVFWIIVVITGFVGASFLIKESFDSWSESPVKTTIETLPISEVKLPKVTVCPPKNTFTDLNYDLMMTENVTLTEEKRDEMFKDAVSVICKDSFFKNDLTKLHEEGRLFNWYHGYTRVTSSEYDNLEVLGIDIYTSATSGVVTTQFYGEQFKPELVDKSLEYSVTVFSPPSTMNNENVTLHFKVEKVSMKVSPLQSTGVYFSMGGDVLVPDEMTGYKNFTPPGFNRFMEFARQVVTEEVESQTLHVMPGFRFSWWHTGPVGSPEKIYKNKEENKQFVR